MTRAVAQQRQAAHMRRSGKAPKGRRWYCLLGLLMTLLLVSCASWTNPTKPSAAFADDAAACRAEAAHAALTSGQPDLDEDNASTACMRAKGWSLRERR